MPGAVKMGRYLLGETGESEPGQNAVKITPMQQVELGKWNAPRPHLIHAGLIFVATSIREAQPVGLMSEWLQHCLGLTRNAGAPIDKRPEHVEEQCLDDGELGLGH